MEPLWRCPKCKRGFRRRNQRHACGTGDRTDVLRNRPDSIVKLYGALEALVESFGGVEIVARERYVLFRTNRIFADLVIMADAVRVAIHLDRRVDSPVFFKTAADRRMVTHVAKLRSASDLDAVRPFLKKAYEFSLAQANG